jgi:hypothetical protein
MPSYDYRCEANDRVVEVKHGMKEKIAAWGELCERAGIEPGDTPADAPVTRLITGGAVISHAGSGAEAPAPCATGTCGGGFCGLS